MQEFKVTNRITSLTISLIRLWTVLGLEFKPAAGDCSATTHNCDTVFIDV